MSKHQKHIEYIRGKLQSILYYRRAMFVIDELCRVNDIPICTDVQKMELHQGGLSRGGVWIVHGGLYVDTLRFENPQTFSNRLLVLSHELCHILVCDKEYRYLMHVDTVESYRKIKKLSDWKYHNEQSTLILQHNLYRKFGFEQNRIVFSTGISNHWISVGSDPLLISNDAWLDRFGDIFDKINHDIVVDDINPILEPHHDEFEDGALYYAMVHGKRNTGWDLKKYLYDGGTWFDTVKCKTIKSSRLGVVSKVGNW